MKRSILCAFLFFLMAWPLGNLKAQSPPSCNGFFSPDTLVIACGDTVLLDPIVGSSQIGDDFNDSQLDSGWTSNQNVDFSNPCPPAVDGTPYAWMGPSATQPRNLTTADLNVACGGQICFDFIMSEQGGGAPCEGPDLPDEGVHLQYSIDDGNTWNEIFYFNPDTNGVGGGSNSPFVNWDNYCFSVPPNAQTDTTQFRWWQQAGSGQDFDHWGLDNVFVVGSVCDSGALQYSYDGGSTYMDDPDTLVNPANDTAYNLFITDTNFIDTCYADVFVDVSKPEVDPIADDTLICDNDTTQLHTADSCYYVLEMMDSFGDGWNGGELEVYVNGTSIGTFAATGNGSVDSFFVANGDSISLEYTSGSFESENTYELYNGIGNMVFSDGPTPSTGVVYTEASTVCGVDAPNYIPNWSPDSSLANDSTQHPTVFPDTTTQYVLTMENSGNPECNISDTVEVDVEPWGGNTTFDYGSGTFCYDDTNQTPVINGVEGGTFASAPPGLDLDPNTGVIDVGNSAPDSTYEVYYTTPGTQCSFTDTVPITIDSNAVANFHYADTTYCETSPPVNVTYEANGSAGNFWTGDTALALDTIYGTVEPQNSDTGSYWVYNEIPATGSCPSDLDSAMIVIENEPEVDAGPDDTICETQTVTLDGAYSGGSSQATWITTGDGNFSNPNDTNAVYTPGSNDKNTGSVTFFLESDSIQACNVDLDTMELKIQASPTVDVGMDDTICADGSKNLSAVLGGTSNGLYWYTTGDGFFDDSTASSTVYHPGSNDKSNGTVTLYGVTQGSENCQPATDSLELTILPLADPGFSYPEYSFCQSDSNVVPNIQGDAGGVFTADPPGGLDIDSSTGEIDPSGSYADYYDVTYTVGDQCPEDTTVTVTIVPTPSAPDPNGFSVCPGGTGTLTLPGDPDSVIWFGDANGNNVLGTDSVYSPDPQDIDQPGTYTYYVSVVENGCSSPLGSVDAVVNDYADVDLSTDPDPAVGVKPFEVVFKNQSGIHVVDHSINFGNGTSDSLFTWTDTSVTYPNEGQYTITLTAVDSTTGCSGSAQVTVEVVDEAQAQLPNVFTPNGDGKNDLFKPRLGAPCPGNEKSGETCWNGISSFKGTIFNRWGNKVYEWNDWNNAWDGGNSPAGTYYYVISATGENGEKVQYKGQVTLIREE